MNASIWQRALESLPHSDFQPVLLLSFPLPSPTYLSRTGSSVIEVYCLCVHTVWPHSNFSFMKPIPAAQYYSYYLPHSYAGTIYWLQYYLSLGGSLLDLDEFCFWSRPIACCDSSVPFLLSGCRLEDISWEEVSAVLRGVWDLDRSWSLAFFSLGASELPPVAVSLSVPSWLGVWWGPLPKNHAPDFVRISCCFRHKLHTHIT